ncbi:MAG: hypothetical protein LBL34_00020 [Clostridiales bacterium]|jgi:hypothetical protein|nr:hypothetical protein [Clostridiales bacterium]
MITGASGAIPYSDNKAREKHAELYYETIRRSAADIESIAKNTTFSKEDISKVKDHLFYNKHLLGRIDEFGNPIATRFDPDYHQALSWQRLWSGKEIEEMDIIFLKHELREIELIARKNMTYFEAHKIAEQEYNYDKMTKIKDGIIKE